MGRSQEDQIDGGERRMKIAEEYLLARGTEHAMSYAIEDGKSPAHPLTLFRFADFPLR